jgi:mono/diheme cytochrome c family protein
MVFPLPRFIRVVRVEAAALVAFAFAFGAGCGSRVTVDEPDEMDDVQEIPVDPFEAPPGCTSAAYWKEGESLQGMNPGEACVGCHASDPEGAAPLLRFAGTVYPTAHEPDDCIGGPTSPEASAWVEVTGKDGTLINTPVVENGNFYFFAATTTLEFPYTARVIQNGIPRAMKTPQTSGDCNGCHTQEGKNGAPGRIVLP